MLLRGIRKVLLKRSFATQQRSSEEIYALFMKHFETLGYSHFPSSTVVPPRDAHSFFVNAGMTQFRPIFLETVEADSPLKSLTKVANAQRCIRVGGKHNDLEEVGRDGTHHTFFEMLGHWSFHQPLEERGGCAHALDLLTKVCGIPLERLWFTYFEGNEQLPPDEISKQFWLDLGIPPERVIPGDINDNFWQMADTGPCGLSTEILYSTKDHNPSKADLLELWNLVFIQFNRDQAGYLEPLKACHMDTGMGLERLCAVLEGSSSNYDTDLFRPIMCQIQSLTRAQEYGGKFAAEDTDLKDTAYRILADHARMYTVAVGDGLVPAITGKRYALRKVIRRAVFYADILRRMEVGVGFRGDAAGIVTELCRVVAAGLETRMPHLRVMLPRIMVVVNREAKTGLEGLQKAEKRFQKARKHKQLHNLEDYFRHNEFGLRDEVVLEIAKRHGVMQ